MTPAKELRMLLTELDASCANDDEYRNVFSTMTKKPLRPGQTWRSRLLTWCESEELEESL